MTQPRHRIYRFSPRGMVRLRIHVQGPGGWQSIAALLDTGAAMTVVHPELLGLIGYNLNGWRESQAIVTASRRETMAVVNVQTIAALGQTKYGYPIGIFALPAATGVQALLGLDFFRGSRLTIDFQSGTLELR